MAKKDGIKLSKFGGWLYSAILFGIGVIIFISFLDYHASRGLVLSNVETVKHSHISIELTNKTRKTEDVIVYWKDKKRVRCAYIFKVYRTEYYHIKLPCRRYRGGEIEVKAVWAKLEKSLIPLAKHISVR